MKLFFWRKKSQPVKDNIASFQAMPPAASIAAPAEDVSPPRSAQLGVSDDVLRFALDVLRAEGTHVRVERTDLITASWPDGSSAQYTVSPSVARAHANVVLLVQGGPELETLRQVTSERGAVSSISLPRRAEAERIVADRVRMTAPECAACLECDDAAVSCEACPLREGALVLPDVSTTSHFRVVEVQPRMTVEFGFRLAWSDRRGRNEEWLRLAIDPVSGQPVRTLAANELDEAVTAPVDEEHVSVVARAYATAQELLRPRLESGGRFFRLRAEGELQARIDDLRNTLEARIREEPSACSDLEAAYEREISRLYDAYATGVDVELDSVCCITTPMARVSLPTRAGSVLEVFVDLGRQDVLPPFCELCSTPARVGRLAATGGLLCPACTRRRNGLSASARPKLERSDGSHSDDGLVPQDLVAMTDHAWLELVEWTLDQDGVRIQRVQNRQNITIWHGRKAESTVVVGALRFPVQTLLTVQDVQRFAALLATAGGAEKRLLCSSEATQPALEAATKLGIEVQTGVALAAKLNALIESKVHAAERSAEEQSRRAALAGEIRAELLRGVLTLEEVVVHDSAEERLRGRAAVATAVGVLQKAYVDFERTFAAWDAWVEDWQHVFSTVPERDGSIGVLADVKQLRDLRERATHLIAVGQQPMNVLAQYPQQGDLGYTAWRTALAELFVARCEWLRWMATIIDPAQWRDFASARDDLALSKAEQVRSDATHALARAIKAYSDLARRARLHDA